jgi:hypothetical protein
MDARTLSAMFATVAALAGCGGAEPDARPSAAGSAAARPAARPAAGEAPRVASFAAAPRQPGFAIASVSSVPVPANDREEPQDLRGFTPVLRDGDEPDEVN